MHKTHKTEEIFKPKNLLRYPRLDTMLMVEKAIKDANDYPTKTQLWKSLPKKVMYQTFCTIVDYLEYSRKIFVDPRDGKIVWTWDPEGVAYYEKHPELMARSNTSTVD